MIEALLEIVELAEKLTRGIRNSHRPTHPLACNWPAPLRCHPAVMAIPNWQEKIVWPWPRAARLRRQLLQRGVKLGSLPRPLTEESKQWSEWEAILNGALSNMSTPSASTYGLPKYNPKTGFHERGERNEFWDNPELLKYL